MLKSYSSSLWLTTYGAETWFSTFHHPDFLNIHASVYYVKPIHFTFTDKGSVVFALSTFEKKGQLVTPNHFLRTGFWINPVYGDMQILALLQEMLEQLKAIYKSIKFHLPVEINDIRPFVWSGFKFNLMHTYEKKLASQNYHTNITRMLKKADPGFNFTINEYDFKPILDIHTKDFYRFGIRKKYVKSYLPLLQKLREEGFLIDLNLKMDNEIVASNLVLLNKEQKKAYIVLIAKSEKWYQFGTHAKIYDKSFEYLRNAGYEVADLFGADVPGFAFFKLKFSVELKHYYQVHYNKRHYFKNKIIAKIKYFLKKALL